MVVLCLFPLLGMTQSREQGKPEYCDELPVSYENALARKGGTPSSQEGGSSASSLPRFATSPITEYKVQVAILRFTDPKDYPFHEKLVARFRPCEQVWVVESRESFSNKSDARKLQAELEKLGYRGAYITELVAYHGG
jgi:hypothetical protein